MPIKLRVLFQNAQHVNTNMIVIFLKYNLQIKLAYQEFAFNTKVQSEDDDYDAIIEESQDLGKLATKHVQMCSIKNGSWCWLV